MQIRFEFGLHKKKTEEGIELITSGHCLDEPTVYLNQYTQYFVEQTIVHEVLHRLLREMGIADQLHHFAIKQILYE